MCLLEFSVSGAKWADDVHSWEVVSLRDTPEKVLHVEPLKAKNRITLRS